MYPFMLSIKTVFYVRGEENNLLKLIKIDLFSKNF